MEKTESIGNRIKELRKRDGRTQEDLAKELGISCQAVSRWETGGGSPDISLIPAVAHYFHISIDELFGYDNDTKTQIDRILTAVRSKRKQQLPEKEILADLRKACAQFPNESRLRLELAKTLSNLGWSERGARSYSSEEDIYPHNDGVWNKDNRYWQESIQLFTSLLENTSDPELRRYIGQNLIFLHRCIGEYDRAISLAKGFQEMSAGRETMLYHASDGRDRCMYAQKELVSCLTRLKESCIHVILSRTLWAEGNAAGNLYKRIDLTKWLIDLYKFIYPDENMGVAHSDVCDLYLFLAGWYAQLADIREKPEESLNAAFSALDGALHHAVLFDRLLEESSLHLTGFWVDHVVQEPKTWQASKRCPELDRNDAITNKSALTMDPRYAKWLKCCRDAAETK